MHNEVILKKLKLTNFKGIRNLTVDFERVTEICGRNATGKSTICDAFNWVLFGKDAEGNSDTKFGIKTNDLLGNSIPRLDHEVTALLEINGKTVELRRNYSEDWVTTRGQAEQVLKGHKTAYFYNGVPLKESEYKTKVNAIIDEDLFRMLTNPLYFSRLDWSVQREMLLRIAGGITLEETASGRAEFSALLSQLCGKSLAEFKAEISARKKKIKEELDAIPARIDEITRATPDMPDYAALETEKTAIEKSMETVDSALQNAAEFSRQQYAAVQETQKRINELRSSQQQVLFEAKQAAAKAFYDKNAVHNEAQAKHKALQKKLENLTNTANRDIELSNAGFRKNLLQIGDLKRKVEDLRKKWYEENEKEYSENDNCPTCGQLLLEECRAEKRQLFENAKAMELERITGYGQEINTMVQAFENDNDRIKKYVKEERIILEIRQKEINSDIQDLEKILNDNPVVADSTEINEEDLSEWNELQNQINLLSPLLKNHPATPDNSELIDRKRNLTAQLDSVKERLALRKTIEDNTKRKGELLVREKDLAGQKAELERQEYTADMLVKEQMNEVERRVNRLFRIVRVKMFSPQINGGEKPDCILFNPDGAKFLDTNSAGKIEMGLDIISTLSKFYKVSAPIFCDNAESVNQFPEMESQMIFLRVTEDKELTIK
jgi:DNA repair exonuclease SbcCD ATPase subunit